LSFSWYAVQHVWQFNLKPYRLRETISMRRAMRCILKVCPLVEATEEVKL
jgi:hypothetical protein